jgi:hypothetical protein
MFSDLCIIGSCTPTSTLYKYMLNSLLLNDMVRFKYEGTNDNKGYFYHLSNLVNGQSLHKCELVTASASSYFSVAPFSLPHQILYYQTSGQFITSDEDEEPWIMVKFHKQVAPIRPNYYFLRGATSAVCG